MWSCVAQISSARYVSSYGFSLNKQLTHSVQQSTHFSPSSQTNNYWTIFATFCWRRIPWCADPRTELGRIVCLKVIAIVKRDLQDKTIQYAVPIPVFNRGTCVFIFIPIIYKISGLRWYIECESILSVSCIYEIYMWNWNGIQLPQTSINLWPRQFVGTN